jgi:predicted transposase YbfD/YdcC
MDSTSISVTLSLLARDQQEKLLQESSLVSVSQIFATLPDPRSRHGQRYDLSFLLTCLAAAILCNCNSSVAIAQWCREHQDLLGRVFGSRRFLAPDASLYRKLLPRLSVDALEATLAYWVQITLAAKPDDPIALDGKTVRGARTANEKAPHLLSFFTHKSQEILFQVHVDEKTNEIPYAQIYLSVLPLAHRICTADALHTQTDFLRAVLELCGHVVLTVKQNQSQLYDDLALYFADPQASFEQAQTIDRHRGRKEIRHIKVTTALNAYLQATWPQIQQVAQLTRTVTREGKTSQEIVYLITTLPREQATPARLLELIRGHWSIENCLHYVRDVTFGEDRSKLCTGHAPQIMAAFRNLALTLIHRHGSCEIAATRRSLSYHPDRALAWLSDVPAAA